MPSRTLAGSRGTNGELPQYLVLKMVIQKQIKKHCKGDWPVAFTSTWTLGVIL